LKIKFLFIFASENEGIFDSYQGALNIMKWNFNCTLLNEKL